MKTTTDAKVPKRRAGLPYAAPRLVLIGSVQLVTASGSGKGKEKDTKKSMA